MNLAPMNLGQRIAQVVRDFEQRCTHHGREWVAAFLNEETVVIALHGYLTEQENTLAGNETGFTWVTKSLGRRFANTDLAQKIERTYGMRVLDTTVEVEPTTGGVVLLFTTDTAGTDFPLYPGCPAETRTPGRGSLERPEGGSRRATKTTGCIIRV
ncbi:Na-translocating system protein MpsC family protein [Fimbriiglobus ruber]|uniref:Na+-translocating membrane potential-generating system MpsC domain-containing protein n=1 Tax=Fimbriiglobus ruber TaxID=1908690 RepID=A0A225DFT0_9BACT|nr:Na-translocating system protein MpsC family protein [Fimbriiglobus ruber]OWK39823.1 hypothetical protein FRUB_05713 [Fimbriiglobus ruber]